ncbi:fasciclin domain-containing protein [Mycobacterium crocinum]|uniref:Fasciclin domain-containing protein n=1 Tax=Mycolicibacterium crocinum TaxID=388459 RepID=A0ABY3TMX9_9MYCO|nr:fasciclin domain-containing protein [Mycolicibacterium crocinum]MCV7214573.1 fasciclin domain-containing protein [Mycolicibacterium crocinum]ULN42821.1 fasciclin domain-containing protein [Mycolicibacterium crocinum]
MSTRTKSLGVAAAFAAIAIAIPTAVQAYADPTTEPTTPAAPTTTQIPVPSMSTLPDPQGSGCDAYKNRIPAGAGSFTNMGNQNATAAIAANPDLSTFSAAISGGLNPAVNITSVIDGGPYVVFAPTNDAFAKLDEATLAQLKSDPAALTSTLYYHLVLGYLGPDDLHGKMPTQQGSPVSVTGKGGDIKVNDTAKLVCGYTARGAYIYMIDTVLSPSDAPAPNTSTSTTSTTPTTTTSAPAESSSTTPTTTKPAQA